MQKYDQDPDGSVRKDQQSQLFCNRDQNEFLLLVENKYYILHIKH